MKATYCEVHATGYPDWLSPEALEPAMWTEGREIFKDPVTDDGTKKSAKGLIRIEEKDGIFILHDQQTLDQEKTGALETVFEDGRLVKDQSLSEIRQRLWNQKI